MREIQERRYIGGEKSLAEFSPLAVNINSECYTSPSVCPSAR